MRSVPTRSLCKLSFAQERPMPISFSWNMMKSYKSHCHLGQVSPPWIRSTSSRDSSHPSNDIKRSQLPRRPATRKLKGNLYAGQNSHGLGHCSTKVLNIVVSGRSMGAGAEVADHWFLGDL
ncbi:hypothetical protein AMTR_s00022p00021040 [Amborella trichopoda]|uniref:Uncharacterized protein n=1 Tax=Amborella trichopoda TaxID=13333 RepID=W1PTM7_AMBTC|nr:hypothetical protein AMTR_s00022p00021040 [Amborella trichopoda]